MPILGDYLTKAEQAAALDRSEKTIDRYTDEPDGLPHVLIGRQKLFREDWTRAWLESRRRVNNPTAPTRTRRSAMRDRGSADARPAR